VKSGLTCAAHIQNIKHQHPVRTGTLTENITEKRIQIKAVHQDFFTNLVPQFNYSEQQLVKIT